MPLVTADPAELGFDAARLARIDTHFARYVDDGRLAGWQLSVARHGRTLHASTYGARDAERGLPVTDDTLWRIYSMTKPVTSVAAMSLWEEGAFELTDPVSRWIPAFADARAYVRGSSAAPVTEPVTEPVRLWHLLTHTSGLTYGFLHTSVVDALYRARGYEWGTPPGADLAAACDAWAQLPLLFQPGTEWNYGVSTDVLGRVLEVVTGRPLDAVVADRVTGPLGMTETAFSAVDPGRLARLYTRSPATGGAVPLDVLGDGLVGTLADYDRFTRMLLGRGELDGVRVLGSRTVALMARNALPGGRDLGALSTGGFAETTFEGVGFGLGFAVTLDPRAQRTHGTPGEYYWGGAASTAFWVDPVEGLTAHFCTQLLPSSTYPIRPQLRQLVHSALVD